ncbi:MAG: META domain-containing protein [Woeseia sp.]
MKGIVAFGFFLLFLAALALTNISRMTPAGTAELRPPTALELAGERWRLVALRNVAGAAEADIELQFTRGGSVTGQGRCQHFNARYMLDETGLRFSDAVTLSSTCLGPEEPLEMRLLTAFAQTERVGIDGRNLVLLGADATRLARFLPKSGSDR